MHLKKAALVFIAAILLQPACGIPRKSYVPDTAFHDRAKWRQQNGRVLQEEISRYAVAAGCNLFILHSNPVHTNMMDANDPRLEAALQKLRSDDVLQQNEGVTALIQIGKAAVPPLLQYAVDGKASKAQVIYTLAQIKDERASETFIKALTDSNEQVRAYAAEGLANLNHPEALHACLQTIGDAADPLHLDQTPAVAALGKMGSKAVPYLLDLLLDEKEIKRLHAQRALEIIIMRHYNFRQGSGFLTKEGAESARTVWTKHGNYAYNSGGDNRKKAVSKLRQWFNTLAE